jgi:hypothetical protein
MFLTRFWSFRAILLPTWRPQTASKELTARVVARDIWTPRAGCEPEPVGNRHERRENG